MAKTKPGPDHLLLSSNLDENKLYNVIFRVLSFAFVHLSLVLCVSRSLVTIAMHFPSVDVCFFVSDSSFLDVMSKSIAQHGKEIYINNIFSSFFFLLEIHLTPLKTYKCHCTFFDEFLSIDPLIRNASSHVPIDTTLPVNFSDGIFAFCLSLVSLDSWWERNREPSTMHSLL